MYRCIANIMLYCTAPPDQREEYVHSDYLHSTMRDETGYSVGLSCSGDPSSCPYARTLSQLLSERPEFKPFILIQRASKKN